MARDIYASQERDSYNHTPGTSIGHIHYHIYSCGGELHTYIAFKGEDGQVSREFDGNRQDTLEWLADVIAKTKNEDDAEFLHEKYISIASYKPYPATTLEFN